MSNVVRFWKDIDVVVGVGVPVIGQNCFLDMTHIYSKFLVPLPSRKGRISSLLL